MIHDELKSQSNKFDHKIRDGCYKHQGRIQGGKLGGVEAKIGRKVANFARF